MASTAGLAASRDYVEAYLPEDEPLQAARARAQELGCTPVGPAAGAFLRFLAQVIGARAVVEIGTGAGVSGLWLLRGMTGDGVLTSVDTETEHQRAARETFAAAGVPAARTRLINGTALQVLPRLTDGAYDLVFADAEKTEYADYLAAALRLLRPGGVMAFDNMLWHDRAAEAGARDQETVAIRELAAAVRDSDQLVPVMVGSGDGVLAALRL